MEVEERHKKAEARHMDDLKATDEREEELRHQLATVKATVEKPRGATTPPPAPSTQAFWAQPFSEEIDETTIPPNFRKVVIEPFDGTQDPHTHLQAFQTQMYISGGNDRLSYKLFPGTLRANKVKCLEVADLFDIRKNKRETLKSYLARFNNPTVRVNDLDQKFFVKAFQKGLRAKKHIEVEEDHADRLEAERQSGARDMRLAPQGGPRGEVKYPPKPRDYPLTLTPPT
ncbi:hypothetical protein CR513_43773, partial [Mucuna pruriens]